MEIYVNLHPNYDYANIMVSNGYVEELKDYVKSVDWLMWDYLSGKGRPFIRVMGEKPQGHIERVQVVLQRLLDNAVDENDSIYIRDTRGDDWSNYEAPKVYSEEEMIAIEQQLHREHEDLKRAIEDLKKADKYIAMVKARGQEPDELLLEMQTDAKERIKDAFVAEKARQEHIAEIWIDRYSLQEMSKEEYSRLVDLND